MVGEDYAWVLQGAPDDSWWGPDFACEAGSLKDAVEGLLLVSSYGRSPGDTPSESGLVSARDLQSTRLAIATLDRDCTSSSSCSSSFSVRRTASSCAAWPRRRSRCRSWPRRRTTRCGRWRWP